MFDDKYLGWCLPYWRFSIIYIETSNRDGKASLGLLLAVHYSGVGNTFWRVVLTKTAVTQKRKVVD